MTLENVTLRPSSLILSDEEWKIVEEAISKYPIGTVHNCARHGREMRTEVTNILRVQRTTIGGLAIEYSEGGYVYIDGMWGDIIKPIKRRVYPPYSQMETSGDVKIKEVKNIVKINADPPFTKFKTTSPYCNLIPVLYLLHGEVPFKIGKNTDKDLKKLSDFDNTGMYGLLEYRKKTTFSTEEGDIKYLMDTMNNWLSFDSPLSMGVLRNSPRARHEEIQNCFLGDDYFNEEIGYMSRKVIMRSYRGTLSFLTMMLNDISGVSPLIMAVVKPEDFLYQKYHILKHGGIDLSRVVVLVDRKLDSTDFHTPALRKLYKTVFEPILKTMACQVWKVPVEFMEENCFTPEFKLTSTSSRALIKEKKELIEEFYRYNKENTDKIVHIQGGHAVSVDPIEEMIEEIGIMRGRRGRSIDLNPYIIEYGGNSAITTIDLGQTFLTTTYTVDRTV